MNVRLSALFLVICSINALAFNASCSNANPLYPSNEVHKNSIISCFVDGADNCTAILRSGFFPVETNRSFYPGFESNTLIVKRLREYPIEFSNYNLLLECDTNLYQYNFTVVQPDRFCYELPYLKGSLICTPTLDDIGGMVQWGILNIPWIGIILIFVLPLFAISKFGIDTICSFIRSR